MERRRVGGWAAIALGVLSTAMTPLAASAADITVQVRIENDSPYPLFMETLGAGLTCLKQGIAPVSVSAKDGVWSSFVFDSSCRQVSGQNTFVLGTPKGEQRINMPFMLRGPSPPAQLAHSSAMAVSVRYGDREAYFQIGCWADCGQGGAQLTFVNTAQTPVTLRSTDPTCSRAVTIPANGRGVVDLNGCNQGNLAMILGGATRNSFDWGFRDGRLEIHPTGETSGYQLTPTPPAGNAWQVTLSCSNATCTSDEPTPAHVR